MSDYQDEWLSRIERKLDLCLAQAARIKPIQEQLDKHEELLYGNGSPGLIREIDRIKQLKKGLGWLIGIIAVGAGSSVVSVVKAVMEALK